MQSYTTQIEKTTSILAAGAAKIAAAREVLKRTKKCYFIEDYTDGDVIEVTIYNQDDNFTDITISRDELYQFISNHYSFIADDFTGGEHNQYQSYASAEEFLEENCMSDILKDYVNNTKLSF